MIRVLVVVSFLLGSLAAFAAPRAVLPLDKISDVKIFKEILGTDKVPFVNGKVDRFKVWEMINADKSGKLYDQFAAEIAKINNNGSETNVVAQKGRSYNWAKEVTKKENVLADGDGLSLTKAEIEDFKALEPDNADFQAFVNECAVMEKAAARNAYLIKKAEQAALKNEALAKEVGQPAGQYAQLVQAGAVWKIVGGISEEEALERAANLRVPNANNCNLFAATGAAGAKVTAAQLKAFMQKFGSRL